MKKITQLLMLITAAFMLTACQITPENPAVIRKDTERMIEKATDESNGIKASQLQPPSEYSFSTTAADGKLTIEANAPIVIPDTGKIPIARVSSTGFSQEQITGFFNYLFKNEKPIIKDYDNVLTKDEIQNKIIYYKQLLFEDSFAQKSIFATAEEVEEKIEELEQELKTAPENKPDQVKTIADGTMYESKTGAIEGGKVLWEEDIYKLDAQTGDGISITAVTPIRLDGNTEASFSYWQSNGPNYTTDNAVIYDGNTLPDAALSKLVISFDSAKSLCDGFLAAGGINDVELQDVFIISDEQIGETNEKTDVVNYAYCFSYAHVINGVPVYANMSTSGNETGDSYALPWGYEKIIFYVDNEGIKKIMWDAPTVTGDTIFEDVGIIPFEQAKEVFETMAVQIYEPQLDLSSRSDTLDMKMAISVNKIELSLVRVREQNATGRAGIYTPAWIFYGNIRQEDQGLDQSWKVYYDGGYVKPVAKQPLIIINAIDGSVIDLARGY